MTHDQLVDRVMAQPPIPRFATYLRDLSARRAQPKAPTTLLDYALKIPTGLVGQFGRDLADRFTRRNAPKPRGLVPPPVPPEERIV